MYTRTATSSVAAEPAPTMRDVGGACEDGRMSALAIDDGAVLWSAPADERAGRPLLLLLHGYGSDERDLFALAPFLPEEYVLAAVRAPLSPPFPAPGWSWYPIEGLDGRSSGSVTAAAEALISWLDTATDAARIGILGFSQGAAVAVQALRLQPERFAFVINLAGYADPTPLPADARLAELRPPVFWGRGARDEVIPAAAVAHTVQWLPDHVELSGRVYAGLTHSVSQEELDDVRVFLEKQRVAPAD